MLLDDLETVRGILRKKRVVRATLKETAGRLRPGTWYIEGPYARHSAAVLPDDLRDAIRGIRKRQRSRELVERILPPWHLRVPQTGPGDSRCSIAYLSNGGNWKLFDLENRAIWTRPGAANRVSSEIENLQRFGAFFNIPAWRTVLDNEQLWRFDQYMHGPSLAHCTADQRPQAVRTLLSQFAQLAVAAGQDPDPALTREAVTTLVAIAPGSLPATVATRSAEEIERLGAELKMVPAHGDLSAQNVFLHEDEPWVIDWDTAGCAQPMFYDVLYLILREAALGRCDLLQMYLEGRFDADIERMSALCGLPKRRYGNLALLVHGYLMNFHAKRKAGQRDADAANVDSLWNPLSEYCRAFL